MEKNPLSRLRGKGSASGQAERPRNRTYGLAPGAVLPDHEHVKIEQTYMLEGKLVDKEGPVAGLSVGPGEFVWREAGTRHVAWTPEGGLMLAMFQVPNKFFEADGRVTDISGADWDSIWGHVFED